MKEKTILFFHPSSELYGADKILIYTIKNYNSYKKILILSSEGPLIDVIRRELPDVEIKIIPSLPIIAKKFLTLKGIFLFFISLLSFFFKIHKLKIKNLDIIYLNTLAVTPILFFYSSNKVKKIIHIHEILNNNNILHRVINKIVLKRADLLVCVSDAVKKNMETLLPSMKHKLILVYNGINFKNDGKSFLNSFKVDSNKINYALIGRIKPSHKGQNFLLDAISNLSPESLQKTHFYLVGSPVLGQEYMLEEVEAKIISLRLLNYVTIIPFVKNIEIIYQKIDIIIVPSVFDDPFPTTVLEGMYFKKPVIGTRVGGIPEMIDDNITGFIVEKENTEDLTNKILYFINNPNQILKMGINGGIRFSQNFSEESFMIRYQKMLENMSVHNKNIYNANQGIDR